MIKTNLEACVVPTIFTKKSHFSVKIMEHVLCNEKQSRGKSGRGLSEKSRELSEKSPCVDGP